MTGRDRAAFQPHRCDKSTDIARAHTCNLINMQMLFLCISLCIGTCISMFFIVDLYVFHSVFVCIDVTRVKSRGIARAHTWDLINMQMLSYQTCAFQCKVGPKKGAQSDGSEA